MRPFFPGREPGRPVFVAHRGASDRALENSPAAFAMAASGGADMIEFDVRLSSDGVPVVFHDDRTGRTAKENLAVARTPAARLRTVRLKNGE
ncbi:MAG TPA: glycerophosphodiester phosphodiesterase family protein, partial [Thermodesulfobacteriota bacterium]|nr:glycerophosphodiester phosphodiesterase family protein [Thermodesulfobacteriota bacterium]